VIDPSAGGNEQFPRCAAARTVAEACAGLVDDLWSFGGLPSVYLLIDGRLRCEAARGYFQVVDGFPPGQGVVGRVIATGKTEIITDVNADDEFIAAIPGLQAEACTPVRVHDEVVGAVSIESHTALPAGVVQLITDAADRLGRSIEQAGGLPPVSLAQRLARIAVGLTALTDIAEIESRSVEAAIQLSRMSSASLSSCDSSGRWSTRHASGPLAEALCGWSDADHQVIAGWVQAGTSSHFPGGASAPRGYEFLLRAGVRALAVQPLVAGGRVTGLLTTADTRSVEHDPTVGAAIELLAAQTAGSLATAGAIEELSRRALIDQLTGLHNAAAFTEDLRQAAARGHTAVGADRLVCLIIDVDHFKKVNDTYGHPAGDDLLRTLAAVLTAELRDADRIYRIGGDEFAVLAAADGTKQISMISERLLRAARRVRTTISLGATQVSSPDPEAVRRTADRALYKAKSAGRDQVITAVVGAPGELQVVRWASPEDPHDSSV